MFTKEVQLALDIIAAKVQYCYGSTGLWRLHIKLTFICPSTYLSNPRKLGYQLIALDFGLNRGAKTDYSLS